MRFHLAHLLPYAVVAATLVGCAPRSGKTHFDRWAEQTAKRHQEEALAAKAKPAAGAAAQAGGSAAAATAVAEPTGGERRSASATPSAARASAVGGAHTSTGSAAKSRVIRPAEPDKSSEDEAIY